MKVNLLSCVAAAASIASMGAQARDPNPELLGEVVPVAQAERTITITPSTRWVNVTKGETVRFVDEDREFAVHFERSADSFDLNALAPTGSLDHRVRAYLSPGSEDRD